MFNSLLNMKKLIKKIFGSPWFTLAIFGFLMIPIISSTNMFKRDLSSEESDAIYGGQINENGYPYAGYIVSYSNDKGASICGTVYLSSDFALTAAHCVDNSISGFLGYSLFSLDPSQSFVAADTFVHPKWNGKDSKYDMAMIRLPQDFWEVEEYAEVTFPSVGCNYEVVGYGNDEELNLRRKVERLRKSADMCITRVYPNYFEMEGKDGGICFGDSGSPIFEKGTNKVVGVVSAIRQTGNSTDPCYIGNKAVATRADIGVQLDYLNNYGANIENYRVCGESCAIDSECLQGLSCVDGTCLGPNSNCTSQQGNFCSEIGNISCDETSICTFNSCVSEEEVQSDKLNLLTTLGIDISDLPQTDGENKIYVNQTYLTYGILVASIIIWILIASITGFWEKIGIKRK